MKYCPACGQPVALKIPDGDHLPRHVCTACNTIHYHNPKIIAGCIPEWEGKILICKRAIEPRLGYWTFPAGFMEVEETLHAAAAREAMEEAFANVELQSIVSIVNVLRSHQVHVTYRAKLLDLNFAAGPESLEVKLIDETEIPWEDIAFRSVDFALRAYLEDRRKGVTDLHFHDIG
jgi:ADP-ribose pyrophosphatase YjhB (NUDIX family)